MGEAWSDWYAEDFLINEGKLVDTHGDGDVRIGDLRRCGPALRSGT